MNSHLNFADLRRRVSETQFPSTVPLPTVGMTLLLQASYSAHDSQWIWSPCSREKQGLGNRVKAFDFKHVKPSYLPLPCLYSPVHWVHFVTSAIYNTVIYPPDWSRQEPYFWVVLFLGFTVQIYFSCITTWIGLGCFEVFKVTLTTSQSYRDFEPGGCQYSPNISYLSDNQTIFQNARQIMPWGGG